MAFRIKGRLKELSPFFFHFFQSYCDFGTIRIVYFSDHRSEISRPNSFAFGRKLQKLTDCIDMVVTTIIIIIFSGFSSLQLENSAALYKRNRFEKGIPYGIIAQ